MIKEMKVNAENWIDGEVSIRMFGIFDSTTIKSDKTGEIKVVFKSMGPRSKKNKPSWHVYLDGQIRDDVSVVPGVGRFVASGYGISRSCDVDNGLTIPEAAAIATFKLFCNL